MFEIINHGDISKSQGSFFSYFSWPSICIDENETAYVVASGFRMAHMCPFGKIAMFKKRKGAKEWSVPSIISDHLFDDRDPGICYLGNGKIMVISCYHPGEVYQTEFRDWLYSDSGSAGIGLIDMYDSVDGDKTGGAFIKISDDYGETWGEDIRVPVHCPHGPIKLDSGEIFLIGKEMYSYGEEEKGVIAAYIFDEEQNQFVRCGRCEAPDDLGFDKLFEPHCVQLSDGRIMALVRTHTQEDDHYFQIYKAYSDDKGKSWSKFEAMGICGSPPHALKLKNGKIILTYAKRIEPFGIYVRVLNGDGTFSSEEILLEKAKDVDIGYPSSVEYNDGSILTVYYKRKDGNDFAQVQYTQWKI